MSVPSSSGNTIHPTPPKKRIKKEKEKEKQARKVSRQNVLQFQCRYMPYSPPVGV